MWWTRGKEAASATVHKLTPKKTSSTEKTLPDSQAHARWLHEELRTSGLTGKILSANLQEFYRVLCEDTKVKPLPWSKVAAEFGKLVPRVMIWVVRDDGRKQKTAYTIPTTPLTGSNVIPFTR